MSVLVEFTSDTDTRKKGDRLFVDEVSAKSFVEKKKLAKRVDVDEPVKSPEPTPPPLGGVA